MATQTHFYPCDETKESLCIDCNEGLLAEDGSYGTDGTNGTDGYSSSGSSGSPGQIANNPDPPLLCEAYCDSECNNECEEDQSYCNIGYQSITSHGDVGSYPGSTIYKNDFIHLKWTVSYWNSLINKLEHAEIVGKEVNHGSAGSVDSSLIGSKKPYTADLYNQVNTKLTNFNNANYSKVAVDQLITASIANAIQSAYNSANFSSSVCDVCNSAGSQSEQECICNCPTCSVCSDCPSCPTCPTCPTCSTCPSCSCSCGSCSSCSSCSCSCGSCSSCASPNPSPSEPASLLSKGLSAIWN